MRKIELKTEFTEFDSAGELPVPDQDLVRKARETALSAYAPYSQFRVGAALLLENGKVVTGNNQENAAYPSGLCAERVAAFSASATMPGIVFTAIAISCSSEKKNITEPLSPCGACRQSLSEYENRFGKNIRVILTGVSGKVWVFKSIADLLPLAFDAKKLR